MYNWYQALGINRPFKGENKYEIILILHIFKYCINIKYKILLRDQFFLLILEDIMKMYDTVYKPIVLTRRLHTFVVHNVMYITIQFYKY